ncbi:atherin-like [Frankliniella occidentalis]|uniref:Atherin-like n=1 Tax=Frankliniella occidentalis TaxID=133901 RepID=A0A9C6U1E8_FRAOC|nr:atherin-like [Frankliniella occidentalis]
MPPSASSPTPPPVPARAALGAPPGAATVAAGAAGAPTARRVRIAATPPAARRRGTTGTGVNGSVVKPVPPPRAHLRIEEDGRLVNRAPAPQLPARPPDNNNEPDKEPTQEQLTAIRKYQVSKARRCAEEDRVWGMGTSAEPRSSETAQNYSVIVYNDCFPFCVATGWHSGFYCVGGRKEQHCCVNFCCDS